MTNRINNKYEYRSGLLNSLKVQHTASDVRNEDEYRKKVLNGLGVEYTDDDINQKNLYRAKVVEGLASSGGGGGSSDFGTAEVTIINNSSSELKSPSFVWHDDEELFPGFDLDPQSKTTFEVVLYKGQQTLDNLFKGSQVIVDGTGIVVTGDIENRSDETEVYILITGNGTITIS